MARRIAELGFMEFAARLQVALAMESSREVSVTFKRQWDGDWRVSMHRSDTSRTRDASCDVDGHDGLAGPLYGFLLQLEDCRRRDRLEELRRSAEPALLEEAMERILAEREGPRPAVPPMAQDTSEADARLNEECCLALGWQRGGFGEGSWLQTGVDENPNIVVPVRDPNFCANGEMLDALERRAGTTGASGSPRLRAQYALDMLLGRF